MLCEACQQIFACPRKLSHGTYYPWNQTRNSYLTALTTGCHLCSLIEENRSYSSHPDIEQPFPYEIKYSFKALSRDWACHGNGPKWVVPQVSGIIDESTEVAIYLLAVETDPTPNNLGHLLATDSDDLVNNPPDFWLVLELYGPGAHFVLPLEFATRGTRPLMLPLHLLTGADRLPKLEQIAQRELIQQQSSGSMENLQLANAWLNNCKHNHLSCKPQKAERWLPTRLLYVGSQNIPTLRLILSSSIRVESEYAALSHRWGTNKGFVLTLANKAKYVEDIPMSNLSSTLKDAVHITRGLGLQYLWVDSMCIVQDDQDDWALESATMSRVYGLSTCTIAAANSGSGDAGCFATRNPYRVRPCIIPNPFKTDSKYAFYVRSQYLHQIHQKEVKDSLWYNRGWVFQERTLSRRLLIFGKTQMLWAYEELQAAELWPCGKTSKNFIDRFESFEVEKARFHALLDRTKGVAKDHKTWWTFIQDYTGTKLTRKTDRLIALQGLATQVEGLTGQQYCAGFWLNDSLPSSLLWAAAKPPFPYPQEYRAPSWSWASIDGAVNFNHDRFKGITVIQVLGTHKLPDHPHDERLGNRQVPRVALHLSGKLLPVALVTSDDGTLNRLMIYSLKTEVPDPLNAVCHPILLTRLYVTQAGLRLSAAGT